MPALPEAFLRLPLAHRALHDRRQGRPENSRAALLAAIGAGYGAEIDVQLSSDGHAMVFHDATLDRLTPDAGPLHARTRAELGHIPLLGSHETVPTLEEVLALVAGRIPLLIEVKDQDGALGPDVGPLEQAVAEAVAGYDGPLAVMSFNPHSVTTFARHAPDIAHGLTTAAFDAASWPDLPAATRDRLRAIPDYDPSGACFISHQADDLARPRVADLRAAGAAILCWTIRSPEAEARARTLADNITFEGYLPPCPGP